jgi:hypothetical protein
MKYLVQYRKSLAVHFIATSHFLLTKDFPRMDGTTYNMNALILSQGSCVCTSAVVKTEAEVQHKMKHLHNTTQHNTTEDSTPQTATIPDHC